MKFKDRQDIVKNTQKSGRERAEISTAAGFMEGFEMLKLKLKPGEYIRIGEDIRVVYTGGSAGNCKIMVDAPREYEVVRSAAEEDQSRVKKYYPDKDISKEAHDEIVRILMKEKAKSKVNHSTDSRKS